MKYTYVITFSHDSKLSIWFKPNDLKSKFVQLVDENQIVPVKTNFNSIEEIRHSHGAVDIFIESNEKYFVPEVSYDYRVSNWTNFHFAEILNSYTKRQVSFVELLKLEQRIKKLENNKCSSCDKSGYLDCR